MSVNWSNLRMIIQVRASKMLAHTNTSAFFHISWVHITMYVIWTGWLYFFFFALRLIISIRTERHNQTFPTTDAAAKDFENYYRCIAHFTNKVHAFNINSGEMAISTLSAEEKNSGLSTAIKLCKTIKI